MTAQEARRQRVLVSSALPKGFLVLERDTVTIGRGKDNTVVLLSDQVSRYHACVALDQGVYIVRDLDSKNGTLVNGDKIARSRRLNPEDVVMVGPFKIRFLVVDGTRDDVAARFGHPSLTETTEQEAVIAAKEVQLEGSIAGSILIEACQLIETAKHSGEMKVESSGMVGWLRFRDGVIVDARFGMETGEKGARRILGLAAGRYAFSKGTLPAGSLSLTTSALAMDVLRRQDEQRGEATRRIVRPTEGAP